MIYSKFLNTLTKSGRKSLSNSKKSFRPIFSPQFTFTTKPSSTKPVETVKSPPENIAPQIKQVTEKSIGQPVSNSFKAETQEILKIVSRSIYTNKEIFLREIISNACDAAEQMRYFLLKNSSATRNPELRVKISTDPAAKRLIIEDNGIGMTKKELIENLGTIARSGSKAFIKGLKDPNASSNIIGQFGVGFYSTFMVSDKVEVFTRSQRGEKDEPLYWTSDGKGGFAVSQAENVKHGTKIIINLTEESSEFANPMNIEKIIKQYSNFVKYPIFLNGKRVNLLGALWREKPESIPTEKHAEFFKHLTNAYDPPQFRIHFHKDFPLSLHVLMYIPKHHSEKYGNARMKQGVDIYSRSVLIQKESPDLLPGWMRFLKGVVDSEDLSLNISREAAQNRGTIQKIRRILVKSVVAYLKAVAKKKPSSYAKFFEEYSMFLKEGVCTDEESKGLLAALLRFDSSKTEKGGLRSFDDYVSAMKAEQKNIYYLVTTNRSSALRSPYFEALEKAGREVIFLYTPVDEFVMQALAEYEKRPLVSIETNKVHTGDMANFKGKKHRFELNESQTEDICQWLKETVGAEKLQKVVPSARLKDWPAIVTGHENASVQLMMQMANKDSQAKTSPQTLEINPSHRVIRGLFYCMQEDPALAKNVAEQMVDNALIEAGLMNDPRGMLKRCNDIMAAALDVEGIEEELKKKKKTLKIEK